MGGCPRLLKKVLQPILDTCLQTVVSGGKSTFLSNDSMFVSSIQTLSFHSPHTSSHPCVLLFFSFFPVFPCFSPQIIANHHMQSISFASGGDP
ncbi:hypothetical protein XENORESO_005535, partial [Xenotaenia resolanae]